MEKMYFEIFEKCVFRKFQKIKKSEILHCVFSMKNIEKTQCKIFGFLKKIKIFKKVKLFKIHFLHDEKICFVRGFF